MNSSRCRLFASNNHDQSELRAMEIVDDNHLSSRARMGSQSFNRTRHEISTTTLFEATTKRGPEQSLNYGWPADCDLILNSKSRKQKLKLCDQKTVASQFIITTLAVVCLLLLTAPSHSNQLQLAGSSSPLNHSAIIIDHQQSFSPVAPGAGQLLPTTTHQHSHHSSQHLIGVHLQPSYVYGARNRSINFTHIALDELTGSIYVGATNWLFQLSAQNLKAEFALKTGPATENSRDCAPADCLAHIAHIDTGSLPMHHAQHSGDLSVPASAGLLGAHRRAGSTMHTAGNSSSSGGHHSHAFLAPSRSQPAGQTAGGTTARPPGGSAAATLASSQTTTMLAQQLHNNNYNKILAIDSETRQLIVCGSLNQGACRKHQLGQLSNYSELIPLPVASNDEHSSSVALITSGTAPLSSSHQASKPIMYVAATNSRLGPYREMVPAISARYLEPPSRQMQIIEKSFTDSARIDISFELRDYYLVNYVYSFQYNDYIYFATVQRKSPLRQLEEWGYITRLARLCVSDLSFQSYTELTVECRSQSGAASSTKSGGATYLHHQKATNQQHQSTNNYNLLQDAYLTSASSHLAHQLGIRAQSGVLVSVFAQSKDHTTRSQQKSAICLFPMERIEEKFNENIHMCYNGSSKARNMNYIAGSVNDCPKPGKAGNIANFCNEPIKLNGSLPLAVAPVHTYDNELLTSIVATQAPTSPLNLNSDNHHQQSYNNRQHGRQQYASQRQHQVLIAGTGDGALKRINLVSGELGFGLKGVEFDSVQVDEHQQEPILADLHVFPAINPQLYPANFTSSGSLPTATPSADGQSSSTQSSSTQLAQFAILATPYKVAKLRINSCKAQLSKVAKQANSSSSSAIEDCTYCAQLADPFCGWCSTTSSCSTRDECLTGGVAQSPAPIVHWAPFDQIKCADYQPVSPQFVPIQTTSSHQLIDVNVRIQQQRPSFGSSSSLIALQLAQAQFTCHFDYLALANRSLPTPRLSGATTKATQARLNLHTATVVIACPLPPHSQRPHMIGDGTGRDDQMRTKLSVRLVSSAAEAVNLHQLLGFKSRSSSGDDQHQQKPTWMTTNANLDDAIERELTLYDCSVHSSCRSCLSAGSPSLQVNSSNNRRWSCSWCPLSNKCTFNSSHADLGCAASAIISTTPHSALPSPSSNSVRASHLASSLDQAQASVLGMSIDRLAQCPAEPAAEIAIDVQVASSSVEQQQSQAAGTRVAAGADQQVHSKSTHRQSGNEGEILIPNNARRSIQVVLKQPFSGSATSIAPGNKQQRQQQHKLECLLEIEGAKARMGAKLLEGNQLVVCQENTFTYQEEIATQRAQLLVIYNDNQVIDKTDVILYKCHLFGVNPPALTSTLGSPNGNGAGGLTQQHSSAAWRAHELFQLVGSMPTLGAANGQASNGNGGAGGLFRRQAPVASSDCSLCLNVERKYQCAWCANQCQHSDQCKELQASTCPPPRIDSIHPTSGPLEGGTLLTIEGSNLGSNEREIQDKISVGGEACQLVMYSVSTRIVCKTGPSLHGPQSATVFVGNRAGVTSAYEKFHYKAVHLTDVNPRIGPVSGGTRLYLTGSNLNIGSRVQIFLDEIPCSLDNNNDISSNQITCVTAPNLLASSMRITKLTLMIDNSTHYLPYPFTYQPDPIITSIEPAESFVSGGRLILIAGHHLASPQSTKLMVYHEHKHNIINGTSCITQNDTLITCLTPAISRDMLANLFTTTITSTGNHYNKQQAEFWSANSNSVTVADQQQSANNLLSYESGGLKLKMSLFMDDVRSVRNLDEYYHHLPHYLTYYEDPQLFRLPTPVVDFVDELVISGENLRMKQLDQDMLITIGSHICAIKSVTANQVTCEPPQKVAPVYDENGRVMDRPLLPIVALIGSNLRYQIGHMQYSSRQYQTIVPGESPFLGSSSLSAFPSPIGSASSQDLTTSSAATTISGSNSPSVAILISLSIVGFIIGFVATFMFALSRFRRSKAEREYKRIQLQMGSLDINGQPINGGGQNHHLFDNIHHMNNGGQQSLTNGQSARSRALDYVGGALSGKKLFYQFNQQLPSFPPSPLTDISSLTGSNLVAHNQHVVKLLSNGTIINTTNTAHHHYNSANSSSSQSSPGSTRNSNQGHLFNNQDQNSFVQQQQFQTIANHSNSDKSNLLVGGQQTNANSRNFNWTQEAPSTIVPYAVIEACNLTLEGKNAIKEYV